MNKFNDFDYVETFHEGLSELKKVGKMVFAISDRMKIAATALLALGMLNAKAQDYLSITLDNQPVNQPVSVSAEAGTTNFEVSTNIWPLTELRVDIMAQEWAEATADPAWSARSSHTSVVFDNKMWVIGGFGGSNDVWHSTDGITWTQVTTTGTIWSARSEHTSVVHDGKIWVMGGTDGFGSMNDVWSSPDGVTWTEATADAAWLARARHTSVVYDGKMWVIGGSRRDDVWYSTDGVTWTEATADAAWLGRSNHTSVVYGGKMWVIGGLGGYYNDVWYSTDGVTWTEATADAAWLARAEHTSVVYDDKMWVIGGRSGDSPNVYENDVWSSTDGVTWTEATSVAPLPARRQHTSVVYNEKMWVIGGANSVVQDDVYFSDEWLTTAENPVTIMDSDTILTATYEANGSTISRTGTIVVSTASGTPLTATVTVTQDANMSPPTFVEASFYDTDSNGDIDQIAVEMSERIDFSTVEAADFTLNGGGMVTGVVDAPGSTVDATSTDEYYTLLVTLSGTAPATLSYNPDGGLVSQLASFADDRPVAMDSDIAVNDEAHPIVTIKKSMYQEDPTDQRSIVFDVVFSEPVTGFEGDDVDLSASTVPGALTVTVSGSGTDYIVTITGMSGDGMVTASIPADAARDNTHNGNVASAISATVTYDDVAPTVDINLRSAITNKFPVVFDVVFSEAVTGFSGGSDVDYEGSIISDMLDLVGVVEEVAPNDGTTYILKVSALPSGMVGDGRIIAHIRAGVATDEVGNLSEASNSVTVFYDTTSPAVTIEQASGQADPTNMDRVVFDVTFSEPVDDFEFSDVDLSASIMVGTLAAAVSGSGTDYTLTVTGMIGDGVVEASILADAATDAAGNGNVASGSVTVAYDDIAPAVTINQGSSQADPTNVPSVVFDVMFNEPVTGFLDVETGQSTVSGTLLATVMGFGADYTVTVTGMDGDGVVEASISAGIVTDAAGNVNGTSTSIDNRVTYDGTPPAVTINKAMGQLDPTNGALVVFDIIFSEPVTGFEGMDVDLKASTVGETLTGTVTGSGTEYILEVTGMTGDGVVIANIPGGVATDLANNGNVASNSATVAYDGISPTVTIEQGSSQPSPTNEASVVFDVVFSEAVTGFGESDVDYTGSTMPDALVSIVEQVALNDGTTYILTVTGMVGDGVVTASIPAESATDVVGNGSEASTSEDNMVAYDYASPTVIISRGLRPSSTHTFPVEFDVVFSEAVTGFEAEDVYLAASTVPGALTAAVSGSGTDYTLEITGMDMDGVVAASILAGVATDVAGNGNVASTSATVSYDITSPTVTINQGSGQADPANADPVVFDIVFSEAVTGFEAEDVDLSASTVLGTLAAAVSGSGTDYTLEVTGMMSTGDVTANIFGGVAMDAAGNYNEASTSTDNIVSYDSIAPAVTIDQGSGQADPTNEASVVFAVTFSEAVTGFESSDVDLSARTVGGALSAAVSGSGTDYTVTVTGMTGDGVVAASIPAGVATDVAGNGNVASTSIDNAVAYNGSAPAVTIEQGSTQDDPTNEASVVFDVTFSEAVTGFESSDVDFSASTVPGTLAVAVSGFGTDYTVTVTGMTGDGVVAASIPANAATDAVGNGNVASTSADNTVAYDGSVPAVTIEQGRTQEDPTNVASVAYDVTFSKPVTGFESSDVDLSASTVGGTLTGTVTGSGADYTLEVTGMAGDGVVVARILAAVAMDATGNGNAASTSVDNTVSYDTTSPAVTIEQGRTQDDPTNADPVVFDVTFSEPVIGFESDDVYLSASMVRGALAGTVSGFGADYTVTVTGMTGDGVVAASIPAGTATDAAGNYNVASTSEDNMVAYNDAAPPTVTIEQGSGQDDPTNADPVVFAVTFSEPVTFFEAEDVYLRASTVAGTLSGTVSVVDPTVAEGRTYGKTYTLEITGMTGDGDITAAIGSGVARDIVGNFNEASTFNTVGYVHLRTTVGDLDLSPSVTWAGITAGKSITFQITQDNLASDVTVKSLMVNITDGNGTAVLMPPYISENPVFPYNDFTHEFETAGEYTIEITMKTATGETFDSTPNRKIQVLETKLLNAGYEESFETFEAGDTLNGWHIERVSLDGKANDLLSSWRRTNTMPGVGHHSGDYAIVTNALQDGVPGTYQPGEISFVYSPSFDFSGFTKPAVSFSRLVMFQSARDGVVFQASTDDGRTWENVGAYSEFSFSGWYNSESVISAPGIFAPGPLSDGVAFDDAGIGWTEDVSEGRNDDRWVEARADLSEYGGINSVRFRFALASDNREKEDVNVGFGFDNVSIFEQRRIVLVEQFSSLLDSNSITLDSMLNTDYSEDDFVVRMNYFTDLANASGSPDPLNQRNRDDPGGRIERYGVGEVPSLALAGNMIDGSKGPFGALIPSDLDEAYARLAHEKLGNPLFTINIDASIDPIDDTSLNVSADFISNTDQLDDPGTELGLHITILEPEVVIDGETVTNVLRKMLPDAAGQYARGAVANGARLSIHPIEWLITHVNDTDTLVVVAFIQDINTHQVYQAAVKGVSGGDWEA